MWDAVRFWLDLGVDGFRLDAIATIFEHPDLPDHTLPLRDRTRVAGREPADLAKQDYEQLMRFQTPPAGHP